MAQAQQVQAAVSQLSAAIAEQVPVMMEQVHTALDTRPAANGATIGTFRDGGSRSPTPGVPTAAASPPPGRAGSGASDDAHGLLPGLEHILPTSPTQLWAMALDAARDEFDKPAVRLKKQREQQPIELKQRREKEQGLNEQVILSFSTPG